ncbi:MAG: pilus assembly protein [Desulfovibrionaceae bacterium]|nr:pilus assembly protein [Desulfovibrionaceae bacterium]
MKRTVFLIILLLLLTAAGCSVRNGITEDQVTAKGEELERMTQGRIVTVHDAAYMGARAVPMTRAEYAPVFDRNIVFNQRGSLSVVAAAISAEINIPVTVHGDVARPVSSGSSGSGGDLDAQLRAALNATGTPPPAGAASVPPRSAGGERINYSGTVRGLLDMVAARYGVGWEYEGGRINFYAANIRTFTLWAAPGEISFQNQITNESDNSEGGRGISGGVQDSSTTSETAQKNTTDLTFDIWKDVEAEVKALISKSGTVTINQAAGTITVKDSPQNLQLVERYIKDLNERLSRQVALSIKVWALEVDDSAGIGLDLGVLFENSDLRVFSGASPLGVLGVGGGELSAAIVSGKMKGSAALLRGLREFGDATQLTSGSGVVMNNQPLPIQAIRRDAYLASSERSQNDYGDTTSLVPGEVTTGFAMTVIPHIMDQRRVVLQYTINLSSLDDLTEFSSGDSTIQLPKVSQRSFAQRMTLRMGQTLVLAGFEQETDAGGMAGGLLGFGKNRQYTKTMIIITISCESGDA